MIREQRTTQAVFLFSSDLMATTAAFLAAFWLRFSVQVRPVRDQTPDIPTLLDYLPYLLLPLILIPTICSIFGLYRLRRTNARIEGYIHVVGALTVAVLLSSALGFLYRPEEMRIVQGVEVPVAAYPISRLMLAMFYGFAVVGVLSGRVLIQGIFDRLRRSGRNLKRILIAGTGTLAKTVVDKILLHEEFGFRIVGMLASSVDDVGASRDGYRSVPIVGNLDQAATLLRQEQVDQLYVALPLAAHEQTLQLLQDVSNEIVEIKVVPDLLQHITLGAGLEDLDGVPIVNLSHVPLEGFGALTKRALDIVVAGGCLVLFAPLVPIIAVAVRLTSKGPILYRQQRMGLDGRPFTLMKFRSMFADAESATGPVWTKEYDPRCTPIGQFLRKLSLDELPQFWNVLRGDMSLVGPRPERPFFVEEFRHRIPHYMLRHRVRAGITGWAQVNGWRGNTSLEKRIEYDLYYVENWSLALDLKILWMTITNGMVHEHAY